MALDCLTCACSSDMCLSGDNCWWRQVVSELHCGSCQVLSGPAGWMMSDGRFWDIICLWSIKCLFLRWTTVGEVRCLFLNLHPWLWSIRCLFLRWITVDEVGCLCLKLHHCRTFDKVRRLFLELYHWHWYHSVFVTIGWYLGSLMAQGSCFVTMS